MHNQETCDRWDCDHKSQDWMEGYKAGAFEVAKAKEEYQYTAFDVILGIAFGMIITILISVALSI